MILPRISLAPKGLTDDENDALKANLTQLNAKRSRAMLRDAYADGKNRLDRYGISIPPQMRDLDVVVGWPMKACEALAGRLYHGGFVMKGAARVDQGLSEIFERNQMEIEIPQAILSTFVNGVSFVAVSEGDESEGEPAVLVQSMSATESTGIWNGRRRGLTSALWVGGEEDRPITKAVLWTLDSVIQMNRDDGRSPWVVDRMENKLPRVGVTPLTFKRRLGRPFGQSRITRPVMSMTDMAARVILRTEVSADFYNAPQRYLMGASEEMFRDAEGKPISGWEAILGRYLAIPKDEDGDIPTVGQFPQASMEPNVAHLRMVASLFCGETSLPLPSLGIIHDNPSSAEAIEANWKDLVAVAEMCQTEMGAELVEVGQNALMLSEGGADSFPGTMLGMRSKWRDASIQTRQAQAEKALNEIREGVLRPDSEVALEQLGYSETDISRILADHASLRTERRTEGPIADLNVLLNRQSDASGNDAVPAQ